MCHLFLSLKHVGNPYKVYIKPLFNIRIRIVLKPSKNHRLSAQIHPLAALIILEVFKISLSTNNKHEDIFICFLEK